MEEPRWMVKDRNFELDVVKYQTKLNPIVKDQDPLKVDLGNLDIIKKKKAQKKNIVFQKVEVSHPLEPNSKELSKSGSKNSINSATSASTTSTILPYNAKVVDYSQLQYSLIVNKNVNVEGTMEENWKSLKKNLNDLFCSNFEMKVKSLYSFDFSESQDKNYKIEKGRTRIEELEGDDTNAGTVGEIVKKMEVIKKEMLQRWDKEEKVTTLKIIIQCAKILNDVSTPKFYCHKFLIIS